MLTRDDFTSWQISSTEGLCVMSGSSVGCSQKGTGECQRKSTCSAVIWRVCFPEQVLRWHVMLHISKLPCLEGDVFQLQQACSRRILCLSVFVSVHINVRLHSNAGKANCRQASPLHDHVMLCFSCIHTVTRHRKMRKMA